MGDLSFRVIVTSLDEKLRDDLAVEIGDYLEISDAEVEELLKDLPLTVARGLDEDEADELVELLSSVGARVKIVEVETRQRRAPQRRSETAQVEPDAAGPDEDGDEVEEDDDEPEEPSRETGDRRHHSPSNQRVMLVVGVLILAVFVGLLAFSVFGEGVSSCGDPYRGPGANQDLVRVLPRIAERYARGFLSDGEIAHGTMDNGGTAKIRESVAGGRCYVWIGLSPDGTDLDLFLRQANKLIISDDGQDNFPVVRHCIASDANLEVEDKMFNGRGDWVVQRYALEGPPGADLLTLTQRLYTSMFVANGEEVGPPKRLSLQNGEERDITVEMSSEWCYLPIAVAEAGADLDMVLFDSAGREVERDDATDNYPLVRHCPTADGPYKVRLLMYRGQGEAIYQLFRGKLGSSSVAPGG
jgi:hypothetical protein